MRSEVNPNDFVFFVLKPEFIRRAKNGFKVEYEDFDTGSHFYYPDVRGAAKRYKFTPSHRMIRVPRKSHTFVNSPSGEKIKVYEADAIRNHPQCEGSPNGIYKEVGDRKIQLNCLFKEINTDKDAEVAIDAASWKAKALGEAVNLIKDEVRTEEVAYILEIETQGKTSHASILLYADQNPQHFIEVVNSPDVEVRGLAKKALKLGLFTQKGVSYYLGEVEYGIELDDIVKSAIRDKDKYRLLYKKVNGSYPETEEESEEKSNESTSKRGRPKKSEEESDS